MAMKQTSSDVTKPAVLGTHTAGGDGVVGRGRRGVVGESDDFQGVFGRSRGNAGVVGESDQLHGVFGVCHNPNGGGLFGTNDNGGFGLVCDSPTGVGLVATGGRLAAQFRGDVEVTGDIRLMNGDCAELFDAAPDTELAPGTVVVLNDDGLLEPCSQDYDPRVVGVIAGSAPYRPGIVLDCASSSAASRPVAVLGKVMCWVDATASPVLTGNLLTTSHRPGHATVASNRLAAAGAVIGKALAPLSSGKGLVPMLVMLR